MFGIGADRFVFVKLGSGAVLAHWWVAALILLAAAAFCLFTLRQADSLLRERREQMLKILERNP
jgi:hypothetical protein